MDIIKKIAFTSVAVVLAFGMVSAIQDVGVGNVSTGGCGPVSQTFGPYQCRDESGQTTDIVCRPECGDAESCNGVTDICSYGK